MSDSTTPEEILKKHWGFDRFRDGQLNIIQSVISGNDTLALLPTGGGKSICFQVPGLLLGGLTLVVSPLIALMKDQVDGLKQRNISANFIHSAPLDCVKGFYTQIKPHQTTITFAPKGA
jgi:ATP-dependent DNA helicase RecQ